MTSYTIQAHATSGESYALKYEDCPNCDDQITGYNGPLHHSDVTALTEGTAELTLPELDYEPVEEDDFFNHTEWQYPVITVDANA